MNWNDPAERARLIERVGIDEYERLQQEEFKRQTVEVVNGHAIRRVGSRFGTVYMVDGTNKGHATLEGARKIAREHTIEGGGNGNDRTAIERPSRDVAGRQRCRAAHHSR